MKNLKGKNVEAHQNWGGEILFISNGPASDPDRNAKNKNKIKQKIKDGRKTTH